MKYFFDGYVLDCDAFELRFGDERLPVEPQVFNLLRLLVETPDKLIAKDQMIEEVWGGRVVSDASIANRIKLAREAIGDDGKRQALIRTVHGQGFRFVAKVVAKSPVAPKSGTASVIITDLEGGTEAEAIALASGGKPSIVVLPFQLMGADPSSAILADAIPSDLIQALSCLRWLKVIARGSAFRFRSAVTDPAAIGQALGVRYLMSGTIEIQGTDLVVTTELCDTQGGGIIWSDRCVAPRGSVHGIRTDIVNKVIASLEIHIPLNEVSRARLCVSENLDSWSNYHLGLQHMYRFNKDDNDQATGYFERAISQDPDFARAHAGLSFTNFQTAFLRYGPSRKEALADAQRLAERGLELDPLDPFVNFTMGRAVMLRGDLPNSVEWLGRAIHLNPNYSQGHYSHAFADLLAGHTNASFQHVETALSLSPLDPLLYAMRAARALSFVIDEAYEQAEEAGEKAARTPGAHYLIDMIALIACSLNGNKRAAEYWSKTIRRRRPDANQSLFFGSFPFSSETIRTRISGALAGYGF